MNIYQLKKDLSHVDKDIGQRIKLHRVSKNLSQSCLAENLGISTQQFQKYENGKNRISASSLYKTAAIMGLDVKCFFPVSKNYDLGDISQLDVETIKLLSAFNSIKDAEAKKSIFEFIKSLAKHL